MLDKVQLTAWAQHSMNLGEGAVDIRNCAERPRDEYVIDAGGIDGQALAVQTDELDWNRAGSHPLGGQLPTHSRGVDGSDPAYRRRVVGNIESGAEADLEHLTREACRHAGTDPSEFAASEDHVDEAWEDLVPVQAHRAIMARYL